MSFGQEEHTMEGGLVLRHEVSSTETIQILCFSDSNDRYAATHFSTHPRSVQEDAIVSRVGQGNGY